MSRFFLPRRGHGDGPAQGGREALGGGLSVLARQAIPVGWCRAL